MTTTMNESGHTYVARVLEKALQGAQENVWPRQNAPQHACLIESAIVEHKELERQARELREALNEQVRYVKAFLERDGADQATIDYYTSNARSALAASEGVE